MPTEPSRVTVEHLRTGDQLHHAGDLFDVIGVQPSTALTADGDRVLVAVYVTLDEPQDPPVDMIGLDGRPLSHQPYRTVYYRAGTPVAAELQERAA